METVTTDPMKAEQAIEKEGIFNKTMFEVKQKIGNLFTKEEEKPRNIVDMSEVCAQIAEYTQRNSQTIRQLDSLNKAAVYDTTAQGKLERKVIAKNLISVMNNNTEEIRKILKKTGNTTDNVATNSAIDELAKEFNTYESQMKPMRDDLAKHLIYSE